MGAFTRAFSIFVNTYGEGAPEIFLSCLLRQKIGEELGESPEEVESGKAFDSFPNFIPLAPFHSKLSISMAKELREISKKISLDPTSLYSIYLDLKGRGRKRYPIEWPPREVGELQIFDLLSLAFYQGNLEGRTYLITNSIVDYYFASLFSILLGFKERRYFLYDPIAGGILETAMGFGIKNAPVYSSLSEKPSITETKDLTLLLIPSKMRVYRRRKASQIVLDLISKYLSLGGKFRIYVPEHYFFGPKGLLMNFSLLDGTYLRYSKVNRRGGFVEVLGTRERKGAEKISIGSRQLELSGGTILPSSKKYRSLIGRGAYSPRMGVMFGNSSAYLVIKLEDLGDLLLVSTTYLSGFRENFFLEKELYMDCMRSQELEPWRSIPRLGAIVPVRDGRFLKVGELLEKYPNCARYFVKRYQELISRRGASFRKLDPWREYSDPIEAISELKDHDPPFYYFPLKPEHLSRYKVFWKWSSRGPYASTYLESTVLPVSGTIFLKAESEEEATYLLAFLNSGPVKEVLRYLPSTNSPKILERIRIPKYDSSLREMRDLSYLGKKMYFGKGDPKEIDEVVEQIIDLALS